MLGRSHRRYRTIGRALVLTVMAWGVTACGAPAPSVDASRVIHIANRVSQALMVEVDVSSASDSKAYLTAVRPCAGDITLRFGVEIPAIDKMDHWQVLLSTDPTGAFDHALAAWTADPATMPGHFTSTAVWSKGYDANQALPLWVAMTADGGEAGVAAIPTVQPSACPSLRPSL